MADYKRMYALLCGAADDAAVLLEPPADTEQARALLLRALREAEELALAAPEPRLIDGRALFGR